MKIESIISFLNQYISNQDSACILGVVVNLLIYYVALKMIRHKGNEKRKQVVFRYETMTYVSVKMIWSTVLKILFAISLSAIFTELFLFVRKVYSFQFTITHPMLYSYTFVLCLFFMILSLFIPNEEREEAFAKQAGIQGVICLYCFLLYLCSALYIIFENNLLLGIVLSVSPLLLLICILFFLGQPRIDYVYKSVKIYFIDFEDPIICGIQYYQNEKNCIRITDVFNGVVTEYEKCGLVRVEYYTSDLEREEKMAS